MQKKICNLCGYDEDFYVFFALRIPKWQGMGIKFHDCDVCAGCYKAIFNKKWIIKKLK